MTKSELITNIATATETPKEEVIAVLEALIAEIKTNPGQRRGW